MTFELPPLPYDKKALEPYISENTLNFHYDKHHQAYVINLNNLTKDTPFAHQELESVIQESAKNPEHTALFNNAAQVWNHTFFWNCMKRNGGGRPSPAFEKRLEKAFGSFEAFKDQFKQAAITQFGSGWAWLIAQGTDLHIMKTANADLPMIHGKKALLTCDVWEHAYYLDYQNRRPDFVQTFLDHLVNWDFVESLA